MNFHSLSTPYSPTHPPTLFHYLFHKEYNVETNPNNLMINNAQLWEKTLFELEGELSRANFSTWFKNTAILKQDDGVVIVGVPNEFVKDWLQNKFHKTILRSLRNLSENIRGIEYAVCKIEEPKIEKKSVDQIKTAQGAELPLNDLYINKEDGLNPRYTFESFVIGPFNELAHAAAQAVIKKPGIMYNPLFIYGSTGHGKTHLIQAIGNHIKTTNPNKKVYYMTSEQFGQDCMNALQNQKMNVFKEKYRKYDVLIVDDIQFFSDKQKFQEELFHLFNTLYDNNKQIIFSSDKHPYFITGLEERLKSRLSAGMTVDIPPPDKESRIAIITAKATQHNIVLSGEIVDYLAHTINGNIRDLEGAVNAMICQAELKNREVSMLDARNYIKNNVKPKKTVSVKDVVRIVSDFYSIKEDSIYEKTRHKEVIKPRQIIMYILREDFNISYPSIGQKLGGRDHTTVIHSCEKIKVDIKNDQSLLEEIGQIRNMITV